MHKIVCVCVYVPFLKRDSGNRRHMKSNKVIVLCQRDRHTKYALYTERNHKISLSSMEKVKWTFQFAPVATR